MDNNEEDPFFNKMNLTPIDNNPFKSMLTEAQNDSAIKDFETSRANILMTLEKAEKAIDELLDIAKVSQHPRHYEVLAKLIDTKVNANKQLLDLQIQIRKIDEANQNTSGQNGETINNNLILSTADMLELLKQANPKQKIIENNEEDD